MNENPQELEALDALIAATLRPAEFDPKGNSELIKQFLSEDVELTDEDFKALDKFGNDSPLAIDGKNIAVSKPSPAQHPEMAGAMNRKNQEDEEDPETKSIIDARRNKIIEDERRRRDQHRTD